MALTAGVAVASHQIYCSSFGADGGYYPGTNGNDLIYGTSEEDDIYAYDGDDVAYGYGGDDTLRGGEDDDKLYGQSGNDTVFGGEDDDYLNGGSGSDQIADKAENDEDTAYGGSGNDYIDVRDGDGNDWVSCGKGTRDRVWYDRGDTISRNCERRLTSDPRHSALPTQPLLRSSTPGRRQASRPRPSRRAASIGVGNAVRMNRTGARASTGLFYALPMRMPETKTSAPPRITCSEEMRKLILK